MTLDDVLGCESCLLVANSATVTKIAEFQRISNTELLNHILAVHFQQNHDTRNARLRELMMREKVRDERLAQAAKS